MSNLVYLMTSLPSLTFGQMPPISIDEFNRDVNSQLSARHFKVLQSVDIQKMDSTNGRLKNVASLMSNVQHDLSEIRNAKAQNRQPKLDSLPKAVISGNPLQREQKMMQWQWEELDSLESGKTFTLTEVLVYKLKLQILTRLYSFDEAKGAEVFASVINPAKNKEKK